MNSNHQIQKDKHAEEEFGRFLQKYLYPSFPGDFVVERIGNKHDQMLGYDVLINYGDGHHVVIDEKSQLHYINNPLPTFAFEIMYTAGEMLKDGWFISNKIKTDAYLLGYPFSSRNISRFDLDKIRMEDFSKAEVIYLYKEELVNFLQEKGINVIRLVTDSLKLIEYSKDSDNPQYGDEFRMYQTEHSTRYYYYYPVDTSKICLCYSPGYKERPINLLIRKENLRKISKWHGYVDINGFHKDSQ